MATIYLDHNATTPIDPLVLEAMQPFLSKKFGNASSASHRFGWEAASAVKQARQVIADLIDVPDPRQIIFTSGATESNNLALKGLAFAAKNPIHIITQVTEHKCILESCRFLETLGHELTILPVNEFGLVSTDDVIKALKPATRLVSIMMANNEIGTIQPIQELAELCAEKKILFHTDSAQALGKLPIAMRQMKIGLLSGSAHKLYGPKGVGLLILGENLYPAQLTALIHGGGHERGLRSGTLNVAGIVGLAKAIEVAYANLSEETKRLKTYQAQLKKILVKGINDCFLNGADEPRLANNLNISPLYVRAEDLMAKLPELALASGSACSSDSPEPSYVLQAITSDPLRRESAIRISPGRFTTQEELARAATLISAAIHSLRKESLGYGLAKKTR